MARAGDIDLHYWVGGDSSGTPVLLWHGFLGTGYAWRKVMPLLSLVRQIGFGGNRPLTIVAHDMGAPPALLWAADHPRRSRTCFTWKNRSCVRSSCRN